MDFESGIKIGFVALIIAVCIGSCTVKQCTITTVTDTYQGFERVRKDGDDKYLMYFDDEVFENTDDWMNGKFNSSDLCRLLKKGHTYELTVKGWRFDFWSWYRNIIRIREVESVNTPDTKLPITEDSMKSP